MTQQQLYACFEMLFNLSCFLSYCLFCLVHQTTLLRYLAGFYSNIDTVTKCSSSGSSGRSGSGGYSSGGVRLVLPRDQVLFLPQEAYCFEVREA